MEPNADDNLESLNQENIDKEDTSKAAQPRPVVLLLLDSWGIAPKNSGNAFSGLKLKTFSSLIKNYPVALLTSDKKTIKERYNSLGASGKLTQLLSAANWSQINIVESEKLLAAWYHLNGGRDQLLAGEELKVVSSTIGSRQEDFKQQLPEITKATLNDIRKNLHDFLIISLSNLDLISSGGNLKAVQEAIKLLDKNLKKIADEVLKKHGLLFIASAYGHAEAMINVATELPESGITDNPVPFIIVGEKYQGLNIGLPDTFGSDLSLVEPIGTLADIVPTILKILEIAAPDNLPGKSLI